MRYLLAAVLLLAAVPAQGQAPVPDTLDWRGYVPLAVGNQWQYEVEEGNVDSLAHRYIEDVRIVGEQMVAGQAHFVAEKRCETAFFRDDILATAAPCDPLDVERFFVRYDEAQANVVQHGAPAQQPLWSVAVNRNIPQRLDAAFLRFGFPLADYDSVATIGGEVMRATVKYFLPITVAILGMDESYGHGIGYLGGRYASVQDIIYEIDKRLVFAQIGAQTHGTARFIVANDRAEAAPEATVALYPNPAADRLHLRIGGARGASSVRLYDLLGREASPVQRCEASCEIDVSALAPGVYLAQVAFGGGGVVTQRVVVAR